MQTHTPTERKRASRTNVQLRQSEQSLDSSKRKLRRLNISYRPGEQSVKNSTRKICRRDTSYKQGELSRDSTTRTVRRQDSSYRQREQSLENSTRNICRRDTSYKQGELSHDSTTRTVRRQDSSYRQQELTRQTEHNCANTTQLVSRFRTIIQSGPVFVCTSCDQLFYKHSVQTANSIRSLSLPIQYNTIQINSYSALSYIGGRECITLSKCQIKQMSLESRRKAEWLWMARRFGGSRFQTVGPQTEKARFPNSVRLLSTTAALVDADRSWWWCVLAVLKSIKFVR